MDRLVVGHEDAVHEVGRLVLKPWAEVAMGIQRQATLAVTEDTHDRPGSDAGGQHERGAAVSGAYLGVEGAHAPRVRLRQADRCVVGMRRTLLPAARPGSGARRREYARHDHPSINVARSPTAPDKVDCHGDGEGRGWAIRPSRPYPNGPARPKPSIVCVRDEERAHREGFLAAGVAPARLLLTDDQGSGGPAWADARIATAIAVHAATVARVRQRWVSRGRADARHHRPTGPHPRQRNGAPVARRIAVACSTPPVVHARWSRRLADQLVAFELVAGIAPNPGRAARKQTTVRHGGSRCGACSRRRTPPSPGWRTSSLSTPAPPRPLVGGAEGGQEVPGEVRFPLPPADGPQPGRHRVRPPGHPQPVPRCAPGLGPRGVTVTQRRTRVDVAPAIRALVDGPFPDAARIVLVRDTCRTHDPASRDAACLPAAATRLADKRELPATPTQGNWRTIAEMELSPRGRQGRNRRLADDQPLVAEAAAWQERHNGAEPTVDWRFTTADARTTLKRLDPILNPLI